MKMNREKQEPWQSPMQGLHTRQQRAVQVPSSTRSQEQRPVKVT